MSLIMREDYKDPVWTDVKDLPSAFVKRKAVVIHTKRAALGLALALSASLSPCIPPEHKDVLPVDEREPV